MIGADLWRGEFGDAYTARNRVDWRARIPFWASVLISTGARSAFEVGCNAGWNLSALRAAADYPLRVAGSDVNASALAEARAAGLEVYECLDFRSVPGKFDLVLTAGLLIHIEPEHLDEVMRAIVDKAYRWVVSVEYETDVETVVPYRGYDDKCWSRPYWALYQALGLRLVDTCRDPVGFDRCVARVFVK